MFGRKCGEYVRVYVHDHLWEIFCSRIHIGRSAWEGSSFLGSGAGGGKEGGRIFMVLWGPFRGGWG